MDTVLRQFFILQAQVPALGYFIELTIKSSMILLLTGTMALLLCKRSAAQRHLLWSLSILTLTCLPVFTGIIPRINLEFPGISAYQIQAQVASTVRTSEVVAWTQTGISFYIVGLLILLAWPLIGLLRLSWMSRQAILVQDTRVMGLLQEQLAEAGSDVPVEIRMHPQLQGPLSWGLFAPLILLPATYKQWSDSRLQHVLLHELGHIQRLDWTTQLTALYCCGLYWYNPLTWLAKQELSRLAELACDDSVLSQAQNKNAYAQDLVGVAREATRPCANNLFAQAMASSFLGTRILAILDSHRHRSPSSSEVIISSALLAFVLAAMFASLSITPLSLKELEAATVTGPIQVGFIPVLTVNPDSGALVIQTPAPQSPSLPTPLPESATVLIQRMYPTTGIEPFKQGDDGTPLREPLVDMSALSATVSATKLPPPVLLHQTYPRYPRQALQQMIVGEITVNFVVDGNGTVKNPLIIDSSPQGIFDEAVLQALKEYQYAPALLNADRAHPNHISTRFVFRINTGPG